MEKDTNYYSVQKKNDILEIFRNICGTIFPQKNICGLKNDSSATLLEVPSVLTFGYPLQLIRHKSRMGPT